MAVSEPALQRTSEDEFPASQTYSDPISAEFDVPATPGAMTDCFPSSPTEYQYLSQDAIDNMSIEVSAPMIKPQAVDNPDFAPIQVRRSSSKEFEAEPLSTNKGSHHSEVAGSEYCQIEWDFAPVSDKRFQRHGAQTISARALSIRHVDESPQLLSPQPVEVPVSAAGPTSSKNTVLKPQSVLVEEVNMNITLQPSDHATEQLMPIDSNRTDKDSYSLVNSIVGTADRQLEYAQPGTSHSVSDGIVIRGSRSCSSVSEGDSSCIINPALKDTNHRVQKRSVHRSSSISQAIIKAIKTLPSNEISTCELSDVNLLALLKQRLRQKEEHVSDLNKQQKHLQVQNVKLQNDIEDLNVKLRAATVELVEAEHQSEATRNEFRQFFEKYRKLKDWAIEMNKEFVIMSRQHHGARSSLTELDEESQHMREEIRCMKEAQSKSEHDLARMLQFLRETQLLAEKTRLELQKKDAELQSHKSYTNEERAAREVVDNHISHIFDKQASLERQIEAHHRDLIQSFQEHTSRVASSENLSHVSTTIHECFDLIQALSKLHAVGAAKIDAIDTNVTSLPATITQAEGSLLTVVQHLGKSMTCDLSSDSLEVIKKVVKSLQPDIDKLDKVQQEHLLLDEQVKSGKALQWIVDAQTLSAACHSDKLQEVNVTLANVIDQLERFDTPAQTKLVIHLETQAKELEREIIAGKERLREATSNLHLTKQRVAELDQQQSLANERVLNCVAEARKESQKETSVHFASTIEKLRQQAIVREDEIRDQHKVELHDRDARLDEANAALGEEQKLHAGYKSKTKQQASKLNQLQEQISSSNDNASAFAQQLAKCKIDLEQSHEQISRIQASTLQLSDLKADISKRNKEISELKSQMLDMTALQQLLSTAEHESTQLHEELASIRAAHDHDKSSLEVLKSENEAIEQQLVVKSSETVLMTQEMAQIKTDLSKARAVVGDMVTLGQELSESRVKLEALQNQHSIVLQQVDDAEHFRSIIEKKDAELRKAQQTIVDAQSSAEQMLDLQKEHAEQEAGISRLQSDLATAIEKNGRIPELEERLRVQSKAAAEIDLKMTTLNNANQELKDLRRASQCKDTELASMHDRLTKLEAELRQLDQLREHIPDHMIDAFMSQEMTLSLESLILPDSQSGTVVEADKNMNGQPPVCDELTQPVRRAANRSGGIDPRLTILRQTANQQVSSISDGVLSQRSIVPNSQQVSICQEDQKAVSLQSENPPGLPDASAETSDLSDSEDLRSPVRGEDDIFALPTSPPLHNQQRIRLRVRHTKRTLSAGSQESMLLQSTPGRRNRRGDGRATTSRQPRQEAMSSGAIRGDDQIMAESRPVSLRNETQGQQSITSLEHSPSAIRPQPNSAIKRRIEQQVGPGSGVKRPRRLAGTPRVWQDDLSMPNSTSGDTGSIPATSTVSSNLPAVAASGSVVDVRAPGHGKGQKKTKQAGRRSSKQDRYTAQFAAGSGTT